MTNRHQVQLSDEQLNLLFQALTVSAADAGQSDSGPMASLQASAMLSSLHDIFDFWGWMDRREGDDNSEAEQRKTRAYEIPVAVSHHCRRSILGVKGWAADPWVARALGGLCKQFQIDFGHDWEGLSGEADSGATVSSGEGESYPHDRDGGCSEPRDASLRGSVAAV